MCETYTHTYLYTYRCGTTVGIFADLAQTDFHWRNQFDLTSPESLQRETFKVFLPSLQTRPVAIYSLHENWSQSQCCNTSKDPRLETAWSLTLDRKQARQPKLMWLTTMTSHWHLKLLLVLRFATVSFRSELETFNHNSTWCDRVKLLNNDMYPENSLSQQSVNWCWLSAPNRPWPSYKHTVICPDMQRTTCQVTFSSYFPETMWF